MPACVGMTGWVAFVGQSPGRNLPGSWHYIWLLPADDPLPDIDPEP
jgi:hypothetical protein